MRSLLRSGCLVAGLALLLGAVDAAASPVLWTLQGVLMADASVATGSFIFDADTVQFSSVNVNLTPGFSHVVPITFNYVSPVETEEINMNSASPVVIGVTWDLSLAWLSQLTDAGGTVPITGAGFGTCNTSTCDSVDPLTVIADGTDVHPAVVGVAVSPEPGGLTLFCLGSLFLFALKRWHGTLGTEPWGRSAM
jgi:hypothetical protein